MYIEQFTLISINKQTKEREEVEYYTTPELLENLHEQMILDVDEYNYYLQTETKEGYYILLNDDIHSHCLSIFKKINNEEDLKILKEYTYKDIETVEKALEEYAEEQERLEQEENQEIIPE